MTNDPLDDFSQHDLTFNDDTKRVYLGGSGPGVVVMTEMPGITPHVAQRGIEPDGPVAPQPCRTC